MPIRAYKSGGSIERSPTHIGKAFRKDLLIASTDIYACDVVGAEILGYDTKDVPHLESRLE